MNLAQLIADARLRTDDLFQPYLTTDPQFIALANAAEIEACIRASLLPDSSSDFTTFNLVAGQCDYPLDARIWRLDEHVVWQPQGQTRWYRLHPSGVDLLDEECWPNDGTPREWAQIGRVLRIWPTPTTATAGAPVKFRCYRTPLEPMTDPSDPADGPEISIDNHDGLPLWMVYRTLNRPDLDLDSQQKAAEALQQFTARFGERPDADTVRRHNERRRVTGRYGGF